MPIDDKPSDGNTSQWDKLKAMRSKRDGEPDRDPATGKFVAPEKVIEEQKRLEAGEPIGGKVVTLDTPPETPDDDDDDDDDDETPPADPPIATAPPVDAPPADTPPVAAAPPGTEAVEIDGKTVYVDPSLAAAYRSNEARKTAAKDDETHQKLVDDVAKRVVETLPPPAAPASSTTIITGPKSPAEVAADKALADALAAQPAARPSSSLQLSNPDEYDRQMESHIADTARIASQRALAEKDARDAVTAREANARTDAAREAQAKDILAQRFYGEYKVLDTPANRKLVDPMLTQRWEAIKERLRTNPPKSPQEGEALRVREFESIAAEATRAIVDIRGPGGNAPATPPTAPPVLTTSNRATRQKAAPTPPPEKPREKYPTGSVSAMLANHQKTKRDGAAA